jgi:hypothetical protein
MGRGGGARPRRERTLTRGEVRLLQSVFSYFIRTWDVRVYDQPFLGVFPRHRAMAPNGHLYFPGTLWLDDFAAPGVALSKRALFIHEGTHLYQWYGLGRTVWLRGPFARNYEYELTPGKKFADYGLEQMGMIAQHYYMLREGGSLPVEYRYSLADYQAILPVRDW